jgi:hypothetical protein
VVFIAYIKSSRCISNVVCDVNMTCFLECNVVCKWRVKLNKAFTKFSCICVIDVLFVGGELSLVGCNPV